VTLLQSRKGGALRLPSPRGPISAAVVDRLQGAGSAVPSLEAVVDPLADDDLQLGLWIMYELHYRGFDEVDDDWEWDPPLLGLRRQVESRLRPTTTSGRATRPTPGAASEHHHGSAHAPSYD
jgi:hypothetical protein